MIHHVWLLGLSLSQVIAARYVDDSCVFNDTNGSQIDLSVFSNEIITGSDGVFGYAYSPCGPNVVCTTSKSGESVWFCGISDTVRGSTLNNSNIEFIHLQDPMIMLAGYLRLHTIQAVIKDHLNLKCFGYVVKIGHIW